MSSELRVVSVEQAMEAVEQPLRRVGGVVGRGPFVGLAVGAWARCGDDVAAIAARIDTGADLRGAVLDPESGVPEQDVLATAGRALDAGGRRRAVLLHQPFPCGEAIVLGIDVDGEQAAHCAHGHADLSVGPLGPPLLDGLGVGGGGMSPRLMRGFLLRRGRSASPVA